MCLPCAEARRARRPQLTRRRAEEFYAEHAGKPFFAGLVEFMTSGPIYALCLAKAHAIHAWRAAMGPTNSEKARETAPKSLRALFGTDGRRNACHGSDSVEVRAGCTRSASGLRMSRLTSATRFSS